LLKKASCLYQNTECKKCDFWVPPETNDLAVMDFAGTAMFRTKAAEMLGISTTC
jgi:hypothetical protein